MTTARARFLNYSLGGCLSGLDRGGLRRIPLGDGPVNDPDDEDDGEGELVDRDVPDCALDAEGSRTGGVRERAERRVLAADRGVSGPQEVDFPRPAPDATEDVDYHSPLSKAAPRLVSLSALQPGSQDRDV